MASLALQSARILLIDDDAVMRELLCALLSAEAGAVEAVETGEAGLAVLQAGYAAHAVLADIQLPGLSGAALAAQLRAAAPGVSLVAMSGAQPAEADRRAYDSFLLKPFSIDDLASALLDAAQTSPATTRVTEPSALGETPTPLTEAVYRRLTASIPAPQLSELYQLTLEDISDRLPRLHAAFAAGDNAAFRREAHALKGGCSMVGAGELAALASRAEAGSSGDTPAPEEFAAAAERLRSTMAARFLVHK